ncbi:MAG: hypothetical protein VW405_01625 [Rhodospirillaceae bacterium]
MTTAASGPRVNLEGDDKSHPDKLYVERDFAEIYANATGAIITMAASAAAKTLGNTDATGDDLVAGASSGVTVSVTAGSFTVARSGTYRLRLSGSVTGEANEDISLEWAKGGTALAEPHECSIAMGTDADDLEKSVSHESLVALRDGDVITLTVLGANSEVITFKRFNFGVEQVSSLYYELD